MTVIAWDGMTLAADKLVCYGNTKGAVTKIFRHGPELLGIAGDASIGMEVKAWYEAGALPAEFPVSNRSPERGASFIVVRADRTVWKYESGPHPHRVEGRVAAFGAGDECALVAMACRLSAQDAVSMAIRFNVFCGGGIDALELTP